MDFDLRTTELGHVFAYAELQMHCRAVYGGVAFPGKRPGFAVVVGMGREPHLGGHDMFLLDEFESFDLREIIRQAGVLDLKYGISSLPGSYSPASGRWIGDFENDAASRFIQEMNDERQRAGREDAATFGLCPTPMLEMERFYSYAVPQLKHLLAEEHRTLYLKESQIKNYLNEIEEAEIADLTAGDYPAIEALAFAVLEMQQWERPVRKRQDPNYDPYAGNVLTRGFPQ